MIRASSHTKKASQHDMFPGTAIPQTGEENSKLNEYCKLTMQNTREKLNEYCKLTMKNTREKLNEYWKLTMQNTRGKLNDYCKLTMQNTREKLNEYWKLTMQNTREKLDEYCMLTMQNTRERLIEWIVGRNLAQNFKRRNVSPPNQGGQRAGKINIEKLSQIRIQGLRRISEERTNSGRSRCVQQSAIKSADGTLCTIRPQLDAHKMAHSSTPGKKSLLAS